MAYLTTAKEQQWLESKLTVASIDAELELSAKNLAFAKAARTYDTSGWVDDDTTPSLILTAMSMMYASWIYNRAYSEEGEGTNEWADKLMGWAMALLDGIESGDILLEDAVPQPTEGGQLDPVFFPTDLQETDGEGNEIKFTMGVEF